MDAKQPTNPPKGAGPRLLGSRTGKAVFALAGVLLLLAATLPVAVSATGAVRTMPASAACGDTVHVTVELTPPDGTESWLAEEVVPDGWTVSGASGGLTSITSTGVKFTGAGGTPVTLSYDLSIPADASGTFAVSGEHRFHPSMDARAPTTGASEISVTCQTSGDTGDTGDTGDSAGDPPATVRTLPVAASCGDTFTVSVALTPPAGTESWLAEEVVPAGWSVSSASGGLTSITSTGVKFTGAGDAATTLTYQVTVPDDAEGPATFSGEHRFHPSMDARAATGGDEGIPVDCPSAGDGDTGDTGDSGDQSGQTAAVERTLPSEVTCGDSFTVELLVTPPAGTDSWLVEEVVPAGWSVSSATGGLSVLTDDGVKFTAAGGSTTTLTYLVSAPDGAIGPATFSGEHRFSPSMDARAANAGDETVTVRCDEGPALRSASSQVACGDTLTVTIELAPPEGTQSWLVEEVVPAGLSVSNPTGGLTSLTETGVKFTGAGDGAVTLTYDLAIPGDRTDPIDLTGEHRFHPSMDARAPIVGTTSVAVDCGQDDPGDSQGPPAWAAAFDTNADCVFEDGELFSLVDDWRAGLTGSGASDDHLFQGIMAWKQAPGSYC